jgi:ABC-type dipeptide/oligopeptide/nickel transport system permease subunit
MEDKRNKNLGPENFEFIQQDSKIFDKKFETKPIGYFKDAMIRFSKNRTNVIATTILFIIVLCSIIIPIVSTKNVEDFDGNFNDLPPRMPYLENIGIFDGTRYYDDQAVDLNRPYSLDETLYVPKIVDYDELIVEGTLTNYIDSCTGKVEDCIGGINTIRNKANYPYTTIMSPYYDAAMWTNNAKNPILEIDIEEFRGEGYIEVYYVDIPFTKLDNGSEADIKKNGEDYIYDDNYQDKFRVCSAQDILDGDMAVDGSVCTEDALLHEDELELPVPTLIGTFDANDLDENGKVTIDLTTIGMNAFSASKFFQIRYYSPDNTSLLVLNSVSVIHDKDANATSMLEGEYYEITAVGTTDFTLFGAPDNEVGTIFKVEYQADLYDEEGDLLEELPYGDGTVKEYLGHWEGFYLSMWDLDRIEALKGDDAVKAGQFAREDGLITYSTYKYREYDAIFFPETYKAYPMSFLNEQFEKFGYENEGDICYTYRFDPETGKIIDDPTEGMEDAYLLPEHYPRKTIHPDCPIKEITRTTTIEYKDGIPYFSYVVEASTMQLEGYTELPYFLFGTDSYGRDLFTLLWIATRTSLMLGVVVAFINVSIGIVYGAVSGYYGGKTDLIMQRISEVIGRIPWLVTLSIMVSLFGPGIQTLILILVVSGWIGIASVTRTQFYRYKGREYVLASRTLGAKDGRLIFRHILPNGIGTIITASILSVPYVIFAESTISYLGYGIGHGQNFNVFGIKMSGVSVGVLLADGREYLQTQPYITLFPAVLISILMITFNMFGNALRDAFNPALRGSE